MEHSCLHMSVFDIVFVLVFDSFTPRFLPGLGASSKSGRSG